MKNLTSFQIASLYLLAFQVGESDIENQSEIIDAIDVLLKLNQHVALEDIFSDDDGGPMNAHDDVYETYNDWLDGIDFETNDCPQIIDLETVVNTPNITPEILFTLLPDKERGN